MMYEKGTASTLKDVILKFLDFAQRSNATTQAWELIDDRLSSFYGATLRVPMNQWLDDGLVDSYYVYGNSFLDKYSGDSNYLDNVKGSFPDAVYNEDYSLVGLDNVLSSLASTTLDSASHVIFNGAEDKILSGATANEVISKCKDIIRYAMTSTDSDESLPTFFVTPDPSIYSNSSALDTYNIFLRSSYISGEPVMVCIGDSITDFTGGWSWTTTAQDDLPNCHVVNKGVGGNQTWHALARWTTDVINQVPDICFLLIGGNNLWFADAAGMTVAKDDFTTMVDDCLAKGILPIIGLYTPTLQQITQFISMYGDSTWKTPTQVKANFEEYYDYCSNLASSYGLSTVDVYHDLKNPDGSINTSCVINDYIHLSLYGAELMGHYIASQIKSIVDRVDANLVRNFNLVNVYQMMCDELGVDTLTEADVRSFLSSDGSHYVQSIQDAITLQVESGNYFFSLIDLPYFYISFEHMSVTNDTYANWLRTGYELDEYIAQDHYNNDEFSGLHTLIYYQSEKYNHTIDGPDYTRHVNTKFGTRDRENMFKNTGEFVAVGLHTLFDYNLWMCEQGGITCEREAQRQINDLNFIVGVTATSGSSGSSSGGNVDLPVFPGTGCPWFTISDENKITFDVSQYGISYWFTKNDYDATITIMVGHSREPDTYQSMSFGMMKTDYETSYIYPLYVAGGSQALSADTYVYYTRGSDRPTHKLGNVYDLDIQNISLSNSNLLHPTKFNNANMSNFRVLSPEGEWKDIFAHIQNAESVPYPTCDPPARNYGTVLLEVEHCVSDLEHTAFPFMDDWRYTVDTYRIKEGPNNYKHSSPLDRVVVNLNPNLPHNEVGFCGIIPNVYSTWYRSLPVGEIEINGKKYLSVPNGWATRLWNYQAVIGMISDPSFWEASLIRKKMDDILNDNLPNRIFRRLLIPLEEGA